MARREDQLAKEVAKYLNENYPKVIYHFDAGSGARLPIGLAMKQKRLNRHSGWPDLFIGSHKVIQDPNKFIAAKTIYGLFIELKVESPFLKDGKTLKKDDHLEKQFLVHEVLRSKGYEVHFGVGLDHCKQIIKNYLSV